MSVMLVTYGLISKSRGLNWISYVFGIIYNIYLNVSYFFLCFMRPILYIGLDPLPLPIGSVMWREGRTEYRIRIHAILSTLNILQGNNLIVYLVMCHSSPCMSSRSISISSHHNLPEVSCGCPLVESSGLYSSFSTRLISPASACFSLIIRKK